MQSPANGGILVRIRGLAKHRGFAVAVALQKTSHDLTSPLASIDIDFMFAIQETQRDSAPPSVLVADTASTC